VEAGFGKIMGSFYDFARHDFAAVFIRCDNTAKSAF
jgi:hypothetical protein